MSETQSGDSMLRDVMNEMPAPQFESLAWTTPPDLADATVAICTSAAVHRADDEGFSAADTGYRIIGSDDRDLRLGHWSQNFDRSGFTADINVVFPIDRLNEMAERGEIGGVAPRHMSFAGNQPDDVATIRHDTGPAAAQELVADGVDVVLLTPV